MASSVRNATGAPTPKGKVNDDDEDINDFIDNLRLYLGNNDNDDLLFALVAKLKKDKARETHAAPTGPAGLSLNPLKKDSEPCSQILTQVSTVDEVVQAVNKARAVGKVIRAAGSEHAPAETIFPDDNGVTLLLTGDLRKINVEKIVEEDGEEVLYCKVGGGCYLGKNPSDPASNEANGLCYVIEANGFAFEITGGITHQSIGGYLTTGADGGTIQHSFAESVEEIEFVDGCGNVVTAKKGSELWCGFGVSMGLMGIVTEVSFRLHRSFLVKGVQDNKEFANSYLGTDKKTGQSRLKESIKANEYFHMNWFPQKYVQRVMQWVGQRQEKPADIVPFKNTLKNPLAAFGAAFTLYATDRLLQAAPCEKTYKIVGLLLSQFVSLTDIQNFCDLWSKTLPSDNGAPVDTLIKVDFTEVWLPLDQCDTVMQRLEKLFSEKQQACGNFATEIYCAKKSPFWLSMSYGRDVVRVDPYWYHYNAGDKRKYFSYIWDQLLDLDGARCHWGKYIPENGQQCGKITFNLTHLKHSYPMLTEWLLMRENLDPDQIFVTDYWRKVFEIPRKAAK